MTGAGVEVGHRTAPAKRTGIRVVAFLRHSIADCATFSYGRCPRVLGRGIGAKMRSFVMLALACIGLSGCMSTSNIAPPGAADSDIRTAGVVESPTSVYIPPELANYAQ